MCEPFFVNVDLLNKDAVIAAQVEKKAGSGVFGKVASFAASKFVSDDQVIEKMSSALVEKIPAAVRAMGKLY